MNNAPEQKNNSKKWLVAFLIVAIAFVSLFYIVNAGEIHTKINAFLSVLAPITLGAAIAYLVNPLLKIFEFKVFKFLKSKNACRLLSMLCTYIVVILAITVILLLIIPQLTLSLTDLVSKLDGYLEEAIAYANNIINRFFNNSSEQYEYINIESLRESMTNFINTSGDLINSALAIIGNVGMEIITGVKNLVIALFISFYFLFEKEKIIAIFKKASSAFLNKKHYDGLVGILRFTDKTFGHFIIGQFIDALIVGGVSLIVYAILDMPYFFLISFIVAVTNVIPIVGPFIGAIPSAFIIFIAEPEKTIPFIISVIIIQQIDGNIIAPRIIGNSTGLSALGVIIAIVAMSGYFGALGLYLGVPLFAVGSALISKLVNKKLEEKAMSTDTGDYFPENSLVDPHEQKEKHQLLKKIFGIKKSKKADSKKEEDKDSTEEKEEKEGK